ncbi:DUF6115 domain-containing protein [Desertibacillus haloalkaliphilus]|uniref:DUF6115 domain-containing protein n=1 Tax=Desertibacillus haloalkaliphilus TaxID=1328930 RepID=UPI001C26E504|nr:hypothetical protein [Desertibacillus haloalkaliphilus]MBU8906986.1 hypothetical protein [Desertibacillus haloalkaliphilus]
MITYLVIVSIILHFITFFWIITLMQRFNREAPSPNKNAEKVKAEIEDLLVAYTTEMKEENERLIKQFIDHGQEQSQQLREDTVRHDPPQRERTTKQTSPLSPLSNEQVEFDKTENEYDRSYQPPIPTDDDYKSDDVFEQSETAKVLSLANQGYSANEIAKKLGMGKGEVELLLKFYQ